MTRDTFLAVARARIEIGRAHLDDVDAALAAGDIRQAWLSIEGAARNAQLAAFQLAEAEGAAA